MDRIKIDEFKQTCIDALLLDKNILLFKDINHIHNIKHKHT